MGLGSELHGDLTRHDGATLTRLQEIFHRFGDSLLDPDHGLLDFADSSLELRCMTACPAFKLPGVLASNGLKGLGQTSVLSQTFTVEFLHVGPKQEKSI